MLRDVGFVLLEFADVVPVLRRRKSPVWIMPDSRLMRKFLMEGTQTVRTLRLRTS